MKRARVMIVDDSAVIRRILTETLNEDPDIQVVASAANGRQALSRLEQFSPNIVTLDVEMPEMDGLETLKALRKVRPSTPVIMVSSGTERGAKVTLEAFACGAKDYVTKPAGPGGLSDTREEIHRTLVPKIRAILGIDPPAITPVTLAAIRNVSSVRPTTPTRGLLKRPEILLVGVSTGGPNVLSAVLPTLHANFPVPIVIVQHMPSAFTRMLAERLDSLCRIPVKEANHGEVFKINTIYIAPGDQHLRVVKRGGLLLADLSQGPHVNGCRPAVDPLFFSVAEQLGGRCVAVVLTGMGQDGLEGARALHEAGAEIIVQDEESSVVWGMPGAIAKAQLAHAVLPASDIGPRLNSIFGRSPSRPAGDPR